MGAHSLQTLQPGAQGRSADKVQGQTGPPYLQISRINNTDSNNKRECHEKEIKRKKQRASIYEK